MKPNIVITIPRVPPSGNELRRKYRHWAVYKRLKQTWEQELKVNSQGLQRAALYAHCTQEAKMRVSMNIGRKRLLDKDNAYSGAKPVIDAMREMQFIYQDSPKYLDLEITQYRSDEEKTEIEIGKA